MSFKFSLFQNLFSPDKLLSSNLWAQVESFAHGMCEKTIAWQI